MATWKVKPGTGGTMTGGFSYDDTDRSRWEIYQDEEPFVEQAKLDREQTLRETHMGHRKFATIPDIVALEVMQKYAINIHDPEQSRCHWTMKRFKEIVMRDYPHLVVNKA